MELRKAYETLTDVPKTLRWLLRHPLTRSRLPAALADVLRWQVGSRLVPGPVLVPLVSGTWMAIEAGMRGATGAVYSGLHEFEDMAFVLHCLRPGDLFVDVGANVGSYTVLAAAGAGARVVSLEPGTLAFGRLRTNVTINDVAALVTVVQAAVGDRESVVRVTSDADTMNQVAELPSFASRPTAEVPLRTLDALLANDQPTVIKVDVEGYEGFVLRGARETLARPSLLAWVVEVNEACHTFGDTEAAFVRDMAEAGFLPHSYDPWSRTLKRLPGTNPACNNTIFVRDVAATTARVAAARRYEVRGQAI